MNVLRQEKGIALSIVFLFIAMCSLLATYAIAQSYNQTKFTFEVGGLRAVNYYKAQAGIVNAMWRIRVNYTGDIGGGSFQNANFNPPPYYLDIETGAVNTTGLGVADDVTVDIGPVDPTTRVRPIQATGVSR